MEKIIKIDEISNIDQDVLKELPTLPNQAISEAICIGKNPGIFYSSNPNQWVFIKTYGSYSFLIGNPSIEELHEILDFLQSFTEIKLICREYYHSFFIKNGLNLCPRIELIYQEKSIDIRKHNNNLNSKICKIDNMDIGKNCLWFDFITELFGSTQNFFNCGFGFAIYNNDILLSESYSAFVGNKHCEVGVISHPNARGKGFGAFAAKLSIQESLKHELIPIWSCDYTNFASLKTALRAGFTIQRYYGFLIFRSAHKLK